MKPNRRVLRRRSLTGAFLAMAMIPFPRSLGAQTSELEKTRRIAESQHEIVMILIRQKEFAKAVAEANKIFEMKWPDDEEPRFATALLTISKQFLKAEQPATALLLLETNLTRFKSARSKADIWKEMGYLNEKLDRSEKALDCFREAMRLEKIAKAP
jgi:tetratricopeptide (TPR) repeat protein